MSQSTKGEEINNWCFLCDVIRLQEPVQLLHVLTHQQSDGDQYNSSQSEGIIKMQTGSHLLSETQPERVLNIFVTQAIVSLLKLSPAPATAW